MKYEIDNKINIENKSNEYIRRWIIILKELGRNVEKYNPNDIKAFFYVNYMYKTVQ